VLVGILLSVLGEVRVAPTALLSLAETPGSWITPSSVTRVDKLSFLIPNSSHALGGSSNNVEP